MATGYLDGKKAKWIYNLGVAKRVRLGPLLFVEHVLASEAYGADNIQRRLNMLRTQRRRTPFLTWPSHLSFTQYPNRRELSGTSLRTKSASKNTLQSASRARRTSHLSRLPWERIDQKHIRNSPCGQAAKAPIPIGSHANETPVNV